MLAVAVRCLNGLCAMAWACAPPRRRKQRAPSYSLVPSVMLGKVVFHNNNARTERGPFGEAYEAQVAQLARATRRTLLPQRSTARLCKRRMTCAPPQNTALEATSGHAARETSMQDTLPEGTARPAQQLAPLQPFFTAGVIAGG